MWGVESAEWAAREPEMVKTSKINHAIGPKFVSLRQLGKSRDLDNVIKFANFCFDRLWDLFCDELKIGFSYI